MPTHLIKGFGLFGPSTQPFWDVGLKMSRYIKAYVTRAVTAAELTEAQAGKRRFLTARKSQCDGMHPFLSRPDSSKCQPFDKLERRDDQQADLPSSQGERAPM